MVEYKKCNICLQKLPTTSFYKDVRYKMKCKNICKKCQNSTRNTRRVERKEWIQKIKLESGCVDCGYDKHPEALHFDHLPEHSKDYQIATLADSAKERYLGEIMKCKVVCANCHAIRTYKRRMKQ